MKDPKWGGPQPWAESPALTLSASGGRECTEEGEKGLEGRVLSPMQRGEGQPGRGGLGFTGIPQQASATQPNQS